MGGCTHTDNLAIFHQNLINHGLTKGQIFLIFNCLAHLLRVKFLVSLRTKSTDSWPLPCVEHLHLDVSLVNGLGHLATEGIDFTHDNPLGRTTDRGITRHESQHFNIDGRKQDLTAHTASGQGSLNPSVSRTNYNNIVFFSKMISHVSLLFLKMNVS
ncbi:Uncharacterised protein [Streptococcus pneumoniae]|nr:Uncharacterised protein [Streptococcus pneumoniae]